MAEPEPAIDTNASVRVGAIGMVSPVGLTAPASCAAMRAGISRLQELPVLNVLPEPIIGAYVPSFAMLGLPRMVRLLTPAVREVIASIGDSEIRSIPLLVGVADSKRPDWSPKLESDLIQGVSRRLRTSFHPTQSRVISEGRAAVLLALAEARALLRSGQARRCVVAGVDSLLHTDCRGWLYVHQRLKLQENPDGLLPGEGAAALEVTLASESGSEKSPHVFVSGLGFGDEESTVLSGEPNLAEGLTRAIKTALQEANLDLGDLDFRLSDVNGEQYYFRETANALSRVLRVHKEGFPIWHYADSIGDIGAAAGAMLLGMAATAFRKGYAPGPRAICQTSSDFGRRAAAIVCAA